MYSILKMSLGLFFLLLSINSAVSQQFLDLTDEQKISLAIDYIRKGFQQEDVRKILTICGPEISVGGKQALSKKELDGRFQTVFDKSSERKIQLKKPAFDRADNPLENSHLWDFDILKPTITITGDTATVDCELVLWGDPTDNGKPGRRMREQFVFAVSVTPDRAVPEGDEFIQNSSNKDDRDKTGFRNWQLVSFGCLLDFTGNHAQVEKSGE